MSTRSFALIFGIVFIAVGIAGFVPQLLQGPEGGDMDGHRMLFGLFAVNPLHNAVHILFGLWGLAASRSAGGAVTYARGVAIIYAVLAVCGLIPATAEGFGLVPLYGKLVWLHAALALVAAYFGWVNRSPAT
ncbi:MAG TPA: DUF4383 domain-containing protein [Allosphingosinicella sp.]|nr:DUF4383 domain-containing protein [Allosphingosinicella sp.]